MTKKKRFFIIGGFCLLLAVTGVLNIFLNNKVAESTVTNGNGTITTANFFTTYKTDRTATYDQEVSYLQAIIDSESTSSEAKSNAEAELIRINKTIELQTNLENNIKTIGFSDVVVSALTNNVNVIVKGTSLTDQELTQIVNIVETSSDYDFENIKIIPVE